MVGSRFLPCPEREGLRLSWILPDNLVVAHFGLDDSWASISPPEAKAGAGLLLLAVLVVGWWWLASRLRQQSEVAGLAKSQSAKCSSEPEATRAGIRRSNQPDCREPLVRKIGRCPSVADLQIQVPSPSRTSVPSIYGLSRFITCIITFAGFIKPCVLHRQWKQA